MKDKLKVGDIIAIDSRDLKRVSLASDFDFIITEFSEREYDSCNLLLKYIGDGKCVEYFTDEILQVFERFEDEPSIYAKVNSYSFQRDTINYYKKWQELHKFNLEHPIGFYPNIIMENVEYNISFNGLDKDKAVNIITSLNDRAKNAYLNEYNAAINKAHKDALAENMIRNFKKRELKK